MSVCAAPTCSHQSFDGSSYYVDVDVDACENIGIFGQIIKVKFWRKTEVENYSRQHYTFPSLPIPKRMSKAEPITIYINVKRGVTWTSNLKYFKLKNAHVESKTLWLALTP